MVQKLKAALGRIELRILFLLATGIVLVTLAAALAQNSKTPVPVDDGQTVATWDDLIKRYTAFREESYLMVVPAWYLDQTQVEEIYNTYDFAGFQAEPDWYWNFDGGTLLYSDKSELAKLVKHGTQVVIYEDMANGELLVVDADSGQEEIVYKSPAWPDVGPKENYGAYLSRELSKRRLVWKVTLKNSTLAAQEDQQAALAASKTKSLGGGGGMMLLLSGGGDTSELYIVQMSKQTNGMRLDLSYPSTSFVGTVWSAYSYDAPACPATLGGTNGGGNPPPPDTNGCTNCSSGTCNIDITNTFQGLDANPWTLVSSNIVLTGATQTAWIDTRPLGYDAHTNPVHRFYTFGNNCLDSDSDGLSDGRELLVHQTSTSNPDTDGDGASDGDEVIHGTNPLTNPGDMDGDGLSDDLEIVLGTDLAEADSDLDWMSDGYEVQQGFNPLSATNTPPLVMKINDGAMYATSTNLTLTFPGLVGDKVVRSESETFSPSTTNNFTNTMTYSLNGSSNGWREVAAYLTRGATGQSLRLTAFVVLDTLSPTATITTPTNGTVTSRAWLRVEGVASDTVSTVKLTVNGELADGVLESSYWQNKIKLQPGTNSILVTGQDQAGNSVMQAVSVVQSFTGDSTAPHVTLSLPKDYLISGDVTNWFNRTTLGSNEVLFVHGPIDDDSADVSFTVTASGQTNGPIQGDVLGTQVWGTVQLFTGTNLVTVTASDAAGNSYSTNYTVIRQTNFFFEITSPASFEVMNSPSTTVSGVASLEFTNATITVNGVGTVISNHTTNITFTTVMPIPLQIGRTEISAKAELNGQSYYADPTPSGYEVLEWHNEDTWSQKFYYFRPMVVGWDWGGSGSDQFDWNANSREMTAAHDGFYKICDYYWLGSGYGWICGDETTADPSSEYRQAGPRSLVLGTYDGTEQSPYWDTGHDGRTWSGHIRYIKHWPTQELQTVVFQFENFQAGIPAGWLEHTETVDVSRVTYRGATGFWYNGNAAFIVPIMTEQEYTMSESDFAWPTLTHDQSADPGVVTFRGHWLQWESFTNDVLKVDLDANGVSESDEQTVGAIVIRKYDNNDAPRQKITLQETQPNSLSGNVILTKNSSKIKVFTAAINGSELTFDGNDNKFSNSSLPLDLYVEGFDASASMRDVTLTLSLEGREDCKDEVSFTVLWVDVAMRTTGSVSGDNAAKPSYISTTGSDGFDFRIYNLSGALGVEFVGTVHPSNFVHDVVFRRNYLGSKEYTNTVLRGSDLAISDDTSSSDFRDDSPQSGASSGKIYDLDAPGVILLAENQGDNDTRRVNLEEWATFTIDSSDVRCSLKQPWFLRINVEMQTGGGFALINAVSGDNQIGSGATSLEYDLH